MLNDHVFSCINPQLFFIFSPWISSCYISPLLSDLNGFFFFFHFLAWRKLTGLGLQWQARQTFHIFNNTYLSPSRDMFHSLLISFILSCFLFYECACTSFLHVFFQHIITGFYYYCFIFSWLVPRQLYIHPFKARVGRKRQ